MALPLESVPFLAGVALAWSLAAPPGPANALIAAIASQRGFAAGCVAGLGAVTGDLAMFTLMGAGALAVLSAFPWLHVALGLAGGGLMSWFAYEAWRSARRADAPVAGAAGGFGRNFAMVVTSPFNWAWWVTVGSGLFVQVGWRIVAGFFAGLLAWVAIWAGVARAGAARSRRFRDAIGYGSALVLAAFAAIVVVFAVRRAGDLLAA